MTLNYYGWRELTAEYSDHQMTESMYSRIAVAANDLPGEAVFVEIGVRNGGGSLCMLHAILHSEHPGRVLMSIDPYGGKPFRENGRDVPGFRYGDDHYQIATHALSEYAHEFDLNWIPWKMTSQDWIKVFPLINWWHMGEIVKDPKYGFVYLDGEHSADSVLTEMNYFAPRTVPGGVIVIDDASLLDRNNELEMKYTDDCEVEGDQLIWTKR